MPTVLIIDDELRMVQLIELFLAPQGFDCISITEPLEALAIIQQQAIDIVLLDVMMPQMDGWELCQEIRQISTVPIMMLTAKMAKTDIIKGLQLGADDYMTKPFDEGELIARMQALLRRIEQPQQQIVQGDFQLQLDTYTLHYKQSQLTLTFKEFLLVKAFITKPSKIFTRQELLQLAWAYDSVTDERTIDSHIRNLRDKLKKAMFPIDQFLVTVWGIGYTWGNDK